MPRRGHRHRCGAEGHLCEGSALNGRPAIRLANVSALAESARTAGSDWLSCDERARLAAISAPRRRAQFVAGRWLARQLLAAVHGGNALHDWPLSAHAFAPPRVLQPGPRAPGIALSHSGDWVVCATAAVPVGVDIEAPSRPRDIMALLRTICTESERARLDTCDASGRMFAFYVLWTVKEAWLKRLGEGVSPGRLAQVHTRPALADETEDAWSWQGDDFSLAVAGASVREFRWYGDALWRSGVALPASVMRWRVEDVR